MKGIRECGLRVMEGLCDVSTLNGKASAKIKASNLSKISILKKVFEVQKKYWRILH